MLKIAISIAKVGVDTGERASQSLPKAGYSVVG
jgi:hypothetical protein